MLRHSKKMYIFVPSFGNRRQHRGERLSFDPMDYQEQNIQRLREAIEVVAGRRMQTPKDFDFLSEMIFDKTRQHISPTTLKRLWGYLSEPAAPRLSTLNLLAQFADYDSWEAFCKEDAEESNPSSSSTSEQPQSRRGQKK